ncbi:MAG TPA: molybdopterin-dependent oxidoreductase [Thermoanaerobaculia bacterium]|nr:molybdopterin-dependent oxidoreductase [Thermoanaerobaculia bacterium]
MTLPRVTIDDRAVEVAAGTNLIEAAFKAGVHIPHYCYHPRLSVVGQCRMCLVKIDGMPKLQAGCSTQVMKDGMAVHTALPEVREAQRGMMEFLLINHPLDCPICDQAGECALQDYAFKHGHAYSRFQFEDKRTYPGRERIPLGANVMLNMNRCIQCTRCVRFTEEVAKTGELGFFNRGARTEIGTFPGRQLDNQLATCVVDICPVGALTSTRFRFAERVFYLDKKPSLCTGCEVGCNITIEHRRGAIKRYKPRFNPDVNDYWMCDHGRSTFERYRDVPRLAAPRLRRDAGSAGAVTLPLGPRPTAESPRPAAARARAGSPTITSWKEALDAVARHLRGRAGAERAGAIAFLGSGFLTTEEAYLFAQLADLLGSPHRAVAVDSGPERAIPNLQGLLRGREAAPNRRGAELAGLTSARGSRPAGSDLPGEPSGERRPSTADGRRPAMVNVPAAGNGESAGLPALAPAGGALSADDLLHGGGAAHCAVLVVCDSDFGAAAYDPATVERLRKAQVLIVFGWADSPLAQAADIALPIATHAEKDGTFVNVEWRVQRFARAFPAPGQARSGVEALTDLLARFEARFAQLDAAAVFDQLASHVAPFSGLTWKGLPATGSPLALPAAAAYPEPRVAAPEDTAAGI